MQVAMCDQGTQAALFSQEKVFQMHLHPGAYNGWDLTSSRDALNPSFLSSQRKVFGFFLMALLSTCFSAGRLHIFQILCSAFLLLSLTVKAASNKPCHSLNTGLSSTELISPYF
jgi:hypothetical protein